MSMIPIVKLPNPNGSGKCYPLSVYESIVNTSRIDVANNIGGYKKGDRIDAETSFDVIFRKIMEIPEPDYIATDFDNPSDETVPSSKLTKEELDKLSLNLDGKEDIGVASNLVNDLRNNEVKTNTEDINTNRHAISIINSDKNTPGSISYAVDQLETGQVKINSDDISDLRERKQDKLKWASIPYDAISNPAVTSADLKSKTEEIAKNFFKVTTFRGIFTKITGKTEIETLNAEINNPKNGDFAIVDDNQFIYYDDDNVSWHLLNNVNGYIRQGTQSLRNSDFSSDHKISKDYIVGLTDIDTDVNTIKTQTLPNLTKKVNDLTVLNNKHNIEINNRYTKEEVDNNINVTKSECTTYTDNQISSLDYNDAAVEKQFVSSVSETNGYIQVQRRALVSNDLPVATSKNVGAIKPGNNLTIENDGTLNVTIGQDGVGNVNGPDSVCNNHVAAFDGTSGKLIKDSGFTINKSVPENAQFTDTTYDASNGITIDDSNVIKHTNNVEEKTTTIFVKITYDSNGHITSSQPVTAEDIPNLTSNKISDLGPYATKKTLVSNDIIDLGPYATKDQLDENDIPFISHTKINGLKKFATASSLTEDDIPNISHTKVTGLGALATQDTISKEQAGLGNVDNTADYEKPVSVAQAAAIKALKFSETDSADLRDEDGIINAIKEILIKLGMKNDKIII